MESNLPRNISPQVTQDQVNTLAEGNSAFALDFYQAVRGQQGNLFFSPYSLSAALAMTYAGARGNTEKQMAQVLHFTLPQEQLHTAFNALDLRFTQAGQGTAGAEDQQPFQLSIANALWGQRDYHFLDEFLDILAENYGAGMRLVDFAANPDSERQVINEWVSQQTQERIQDLIPPEGVTTATRLVLTNAIYFKADWLSPFASDLTREMPFYLLDGSQTEVAMMAYQQPANLSYLEGVGFQAVELPYAGERTAMLILVPDAGTFAEFEEHLTADQLNSIRLEMQPQAVSLRLPKFRYENEYDLADTLAGMGMVDAFGEEADFSGMDGLQHSLFISDVFHKAFVAVDEKGTEAAAATAVVMSKMAMVQSIEMTVDRPFVFLILDKPGGTILFLGRVVEPRGNS
ncbi:MAG: serpin family protein [Chloroflexota bacterium]